MAGTRKGTYKITNWRNYNESLVQRGSITFWFSEEALAEWNHANRRPSVGHPFVYGDRAIESLLALRELFRLPYRQTEGLARSLARLMGVDVAIPDFTSLSKRAGALRISLDVSKHAGPIDVVVDSTGLKVFGEGEWKVRAHGKSKRRTWRKLHLVVNPATQEIEAEVLTENSGHDAESSRSFHRVATRRSSGTAIRTAGRCRVTRRSATFAGWAANDGRKRLVIIVAASGKPPCTA